MRNIIKKIRSNRVLFILLSITILSIIFGVLFLAMQDNNVKGQVSTSLKGIIETIISNNYNSLTIMVKSLKTNVFIGVSIWLLGISMIGIPLILIIYILKCVMLGFTLASFIYFYGFKGILLGSIYILPYIISVFIQFIMVYYAIKFSILLFNNLFRKRDFSKRAVVRRYIRVLLINIVLLFITSLIESYIVPVIIKLINF